MQRMLRDNDAAGLCRAMSAQCPDDPRVPGLVSYALSGVLPHGGIEVRDLVEAALLAQIGQLHGRATISSAPRHLVPMSFDSLADDRGPSGWTAIQWLNLLLLREIAPTRTIAALVTMRDDGLSLVEWVAHYRALGVDAIYVYSNDNIDQSDALLACLAEHGEIIYLENQVAQSVHPQRKAYAHALQLLPELRDFRWVFFLDSDEFFIPDPLGKPDVGSVLREIMTHFPEQRPSAISFQWRWYVSGGRYGWEDDLLLRRFRHAQDHYLSKSLVRLRDVTSMRLLHFPDLVAGAFAVRSGLDVIAPQSYWDRRPPCYHRGQINHYWTKSFEEFSIKKARGDAVDAVGSDYQRDFAKFFEYNGAETAENAVPPPANLLARVERQQTRLMALPGVAGCVSAVRARLPAMLARFDHLGGLRAIYDQLNAAPPT